MNTYVINLLSAVSIGIIIGLMARVHDARTKALIYSLPIPITIALIATNGIVTTSNIIGLALICGFIYLTYILHTIMRLHIIVSDVASAAAYIGIGYLLIKTFHISFLTSVITYLVLWLIGMFLLRNHQVVENPRHPSAISPLTKTGVTTVVGFIMFSLKNVLSGIVVTFPYSGVFAVIETRSNLQIMSRIIFRNSAAILGLFVTLFLLQDRLSLVFRLLIAWIIFIGILNLVQRLKV
jgi:hypothetical protein